SDIVQCPTEKAQNRSHVDEQYLRESSEDLDDTEFDSQLAVEESHQAECNGLLLVIFSPTLLNNHLTIILASYQTVNFFIDFKGIEYDEEPSTSTPKGKLNCFLAARDVSPIRTSMMTPWEEAAGRTKRHYLWKARQVVFATLGEIAPNNSEMLFRAIKERQLDENDNTDCMLLEALTACYENASHWSSRRQILSIFADKKHIRIKVPPEKLDHFLAFITSARVIQDLPFGEKTLKLSTTEIKIPNVIRNSIPEQIIQQYQSYSEGGRAFDDMVTVVDKLGDVYELGLTWSKEQIRKPKLAKHYFKSDYKVHVSSTSRVPDHCRPYALSLANDSNFTTTCNHQHDLVCDRCNLFPAVVQELELQVEKARIPHKDKEEMKFVVAQSKKNIEAWKAHILRFINQDEARLDILKAVDDSSVLVVLDWAMKFIPRKYRESQADWFGKRGLSWHISVAMKKPPGKTLQTLTLVHVFQKSNQDSLYVLAVIDDVIEKLKTAIPGLKSVSFRQDNAGCYHSAATILGIHQLAIKHNVCVRMDFCDPQGGKGPCDRKAASIKNHMRSYLNSGHDISSAQDMKSAIESNGGVRGVATILCGPLTCPTMDAALLSRFSA
ncbi:Hypothetical predicted protein, partial [Paramuricea clavata]